MAKGQVAAEPEARSAALERILEEYRRAWETGDAELAASLFTEDATYQENPFSEPLAGREAIRRYWGQATASHREVRFRWKRLGSAGNLNFVEWDCEFLRADGGRKLELRGVMLIELRGGRIANFREFWHRRETAGGQAAY